MATAEQERAFRLQEVIEWFEALTSDVTVPLADAQQLAADIRATRAADHCRSPLDGKLETEALTTYSDEFAAPVSIAISLKRIADTLDGTAAGICVTQTIFAGRAF